MHSAIKIALSTILLISSSACGNPENNRQNQPQGNARQLQQQQCILQKQQRINQASSKMSTARQNRNYCSVDGCRDYWNIKEAEASEEYNQAIQSAYSPDC